MNAVLSSAEVVHILAHTSGITLRSSNWGVHHFQPRSNLKQNPIETILF